MKIQDFYFSIIISGVPKYEYEINDNSPVDEGIRNQITRIATAQSSVM